MALLNAFSMAQSPPAVEATLNPDERLRPGFSLLWTPCGQAAWDMMRQFHKVDAIELDPPSPSANVMNTFKWDAAKVLPPGTFVFGGMDSPAVRLHVRAQVERIAGRHAAAIIGDYQPPGEIAPGVHRLGSALFVSCLAQKTRFPGHFIPDPNRRAFGSEAAPALVEGFGCAGQRSGTYGDNVIVLKDDLKGTTVLKFTLHSETPGLSQSLMLLQHPNLESIAQGLEVIREAVRNPLPELSVVEASGKSWRYTRHLLVGDQFWMPYLKTNLIFDFADLIGGTYLHKLAANQITTTYWQIREAQQFLHLQLGHEGVLVEAVFKIPVDYLSSSEGSAAAPADLSQLPSYPKNFIYNKPFLATLWLKDADWPYLACWVDGPALLRAP